MTSVSDVVLHVLLIRATIEEQPSQPALNECRGA